MRRPARSAYGQPPREVFVDPTPSLRAACLVAMVAALAAPTTASAMCPTGFLEVGDQGIPLGCIQESEEDASGNESWQDASITCSTTHGGRLPTFQEWWLARSSVSLIDNGTDREWTAEVKTISDIESATAVRPSAGQPSVLDGRSMQIGSNGSAEVRCWIPAQGLRITQLVPALTTLGAGILAAVLMASGLRSWRRDGRFDSRDTGHGPESAPA